MPTLLLLKFTEVVNNGAMYLRCRNRRKNGKDHRYWSVVESYRVRGGGTLQRQLLYLGELNDTQREGWIR